MMVQGPPFVNEAKEHAHGFMRAQSTLTSQEDGAQDAGRAPTRK